MQMCSGTAALGWGLYVRLMTVSLADLPVYDVLSEYVPDDAWSTVAISIGLLQIGAAMTSMWFPGPTRWWRWAGAWGGLVWFKILAVSMFKSGQSTPMALVICVIAIYNIPAIVLLLRRRA